VLAPQLAAGFGIADMVAGRSLVEVNPEGNEFDIN
jgi:hypothetical protein